MYVGVTSLRLMFMNAENLFSPGESFYGSKYSKHDYDEKVDWISSMIADRHVHVCALSEIGKVADTCLQDIITSVNVKDKTGWAPFKYKIAFQPSSTGSPIRVAIISRFQLSDTTSLVKYPVKFHVDLLSPGTDSSDSENWTFIPSYEFSRPVGKAKITPPGKTPFNLFIIHLKSKRPKTSPHDGYNVAIGMARSSIQRNVEAAALRYYLDDFLPSQYGSDPKIPSILVGDFNDVPNSVPLENIRGPFDKNPGVSGSWSNLDRLRLISCARLHLKKVAYEDKLFSYVYEEHFSLIDQAFVTEHLVNKFIRMEVYNDHVFRHQELKSKSRTDVEQQWKTVVSDHGVILIEFKHMV